MDLSVIIVNYNAKLLLEQCLLSVQKAIGLSQYDSEIFVIDNNSVDGSQEYITDLFPAIRYCFNKENTGFAKACNQGFAMASGNYIIPESRYGVAGKLFSKMYFIF
jgi:O-antigen biosynthesis protein